MNIMNQQNIRIVSRRLVNTPVIDWAIIIGLSLAAVVVLVAFGIYVYLGTESRLNAPLNPILAPHEDFNADLLKSVVGDADMRAAVWKDQAVHYPIAPDPSLP
jgi:hypothetical protein